MKTLWLATQNAAKARFYRDVLGDLLAVSASTNSQRNSNVEETLDNAAINAQRKADAYYGRTERPVLGEDTSLCIPALDGLPGPAIRRWGGSLSDDVSDHEWMRFFFTQIAPLDTGAGVPCVKSHHYALRTHGRSASLKLDFPCRIVLRDYQAGHPFYGGPLSYVLKYEQFNRYENELSLLEKKGLFAPLRFFVEHEVLRRA